MDVFDAIRIDPQVEELTRRLATARGAVAAEGLWGSSAPILAALVAERLNRPLLLVAGHSDDADDYRDDIETVLGVAPDLLPQLDEMSDADDAANELAGERLRLCLSHVGTWEGGNVRTATPPTARAVADRSRVPTIPRSHVVAPILALMQPVPSAETLAASSRDVQVGQTLGPDSLTDWLSRHGFRRGDAVQEPGDFARRGGIVDVFSRAQTDPVRIEFFGDAVESIRLFDLATQRSSQPLQAVQIPGVSGTSGTGAQDCYLSLLPVDTLVALHEPTEIQELGRTFWHRLGEEAGLLSVETVLRRARDFTQLHLHCFNSTLQDVVRLPVTSLPQFEAKTPDALRALGELSQTASVVVLCDNRAEEQRFRELLNQSAGEHGPPARAMGNERADEVATPAASSLVARAGGPCSPRAVATSVGVLHHGFQWRQTAFIPHHELFHRYRQRRTLRRVQPARPTDSFFDLQAGDHVVHTLHGIGRFLGLKTMQREDRTDEYLAIEFAEKAVVHVPISQIHLVQKYIGSFRGRPKLSTLGGTAWKKTKERVAAAITDLAAELLALQARRATEAGLAYPHDTQWQREFEESFLYEETPDQLRTLAELKADLQRPRPMDRLLCGDVGFGKTELAIRAAFKVAEYGKQVAVLVPTTVLAEQHYETFRERLADYPFAVEVLSRFRTRKEQNAIIERARKGQVDILIGTHRLLSADVSFADLGLIVIDEEQRFGVEAKERLKRLRATVDVLTLTATPIPRTLHMAMLGLRDISSLATPPLDRRAIVTQVRLWDEHLIREAVLRELQRDGQVYFVNNLVRDIHEVANRLRALVPEARVVVGHGQMAAHELEDVMVKFLHREADVLVATNIIESGLDIPSANTIFINRADCFGLADLHQLRGRVGRSKHRAYAYGLLSPRRTVTEIAARRLKALERYSELGAGFQIAMRDLEIRGAGNILGAEQSGHIEAVGYELYCQLLEQAVRRVRNEPAEVYRQVNLDLGVSATIQRTYIRGDRQRMDVYKRLVSCRDLTELETLRADLRDAFGPLPADVETLLALAEIRVLAGPWGIRALVLKPPDVVFAIDDLQKVQPLLAHGPGSPRIPDPQTIHWRLPKRLLETAALLDVLRQQLRTKPPL